LCTLREAITAANTNSPSGLPAGECVAGTTGSDTIDATGIAGTITLTTALPPISSDLKINGPGANALTVQRSTDFGTPTFRIFTVSSGTVAINNIAITQGLTADGAGPTFLGDFGGGILNNSTLTLDGDRISGNQTGNGSVSGGHGGGIYNLGTLTITRSTISGNTTGNGGNGGSGGGILNGGTLTIVNSTIAGNQTGNAGSGAQAGGAGGGIYNAGSSTLNLINTTISGNTTGNGAAGSLSCDGGGVFNQGITNFKNTIVANNIVGTSGSGPDLAGTFNSQDYNLIENTSGSSITGAASHNITGIDPKLGSLTNNGGPTQTLAPLVGSPAIDAGDNCVVANSCSPTLPSAITSDQRGVGFTRPSDGNGDDTDVVDIGAYEVQALFVTNTNNAGAGSLRQALIDGNVSLDSNFIKFQPGVTGTITLVTALPNISTPMTIRGPGADQLTVSGNNSIRVFSLLVSSPHVVNISGLTVANGSGGSGSGVLNNFTGGANLSNLAVTGNATGSAVYNANSGPITIRSSVFTNNSGGNGGAVFNTFSGTITIVNSAFSQNSASSSGGAVANQNLGTINIVNCTLSQNSASASGAIDNRGTLNVINSTLSGNVGTIGVGGAISSADGNMTLTNTTVSQNSGIGGGIYSIRGSSKLKNTIVAGNTDSATGCPDLKGDFVSQGYNLIGKSDGSTGFTNGVNNDQVGTAAAPLDALLIPLSNNGGATPVRFTMLPQPSSPAINAGNISNLPADTFDLDNDGNTSEAVPVDQRGFARVIGTSLDIGAVETNYSIGATAGNGQSTQIKTTFPMQLQATVTESSMVKSGIPVSFVAPASGSSGLFPGNLSTVSVNTDSGGVATAPLFTANGTAGGPYNVIASATSGLSTANFSLTNLKGTATITLGNLSQGYDGTAKFATATTNPGGLSVVITYSQNGQPVTSPTEIGSYDVAAVINDNNYQGSATGTLLIGPMLLMEEGGNRLAALDSVTFVKGPFKVLNEVNFSSDHHTRIIFFTSNLGLSQPNSSLLTVQAAGIPLEVEAVGPLSGVAGLNGSYVVVKLADGLPVGDIPLGITLRGIPSASGTIGIAP
jgi:hypothetical protein